MGGRRVCASCGATLPCDQNLPPKVEGVCDACGGKLEAQRDDDKPETVRDRLEVYHSETEPLKDFYGQRATCQNRRRISRH